MTTGAQNESVEHVRPSAARRRSAAASSWWAAALVAFGVVVFSPGFVLLVFALAAFVGGMLWTAIVYAALAMAPGASSP